jgi:hypothetical protein
MIYHTGTISGYHAIIWWLPEEKLGVAILLNRVERAMPHIRCLTLADRILKLPATDWNAIYKKHPTPDPAPHKQVEGTRPSHPLPQYAGRYHHPGYGTVTVTVTVTETNTGLTLDRSGSKLILKHWHYDTFAASRELVAFQTAPDGAISTLTMRLEPAVPEIRFTRAKP